MWLLHYMMVGKRIVTSSMEMKPFMCFLGSTKDINLSKHPSTEEKTSNDGSSAGNCKQVTVADVLCGMQATAIPACCSQLWSWSVFDLTKGKSHYGQGGGYNHFAGRIQGSVRSWQDYGPNRHPRFLCSRA